MTKCKLYNYIYIYVGKTGHWWLIVCCSQIRMRVADDHVPSCVVTHARTPHEAMHARNLNMTNRSSLLLSTVGRSKTLYICTYICMSSIFIRKTNPTTWRLSFLWVLLPAGEIIISSRASSSSPRQFRGCNWDARLLRSCHQTPDFLKDSGISCHCGSTAKYQHGNTI